MTDATGRAGRREALDYSKIAASASHRLAPFPAGHILGQSYSIHWHRRLNRYPVWGRPIQEIRLKFEDLGLLPELLRAVHETGYTEPTPIQAQAIPIIQSGKDVMGGAQTGTGKTAGFTLPLLQRLARHASTSPSPARHPVRALILTPTRELAMQVFDSVKTYGKYVPLRATCIYGGVDMKPQIAEMKEGREIVVATPGRLLDHVQQKTVNFGAVEVLVLDEADRMLDMGFIPDIKRILALLPKERQSLLFSATFSDEIKTLADGLLNKPALIEVARRNSTVEVIAQKIHPVDRNRKAEMLTHLIGTHNWFQVLVFTRTKHGANRLAEQLEKSGIVAMAIHGNKSQGARTKALSGFKDGSVRVLVATDIAARGIDIDQLPQVVNYELPNVPEDYVHRIGRTGRAGSEGAAVSLVDAEEMGYLKDIERLIKRGIARVEVEGFVPPERPAGHLPERDDRPPRQGRPGGQGRGDGRGQGRGQRSGKPGGNAPRASASTAKPAMPKPAGPKPAASPQVPRPANTSGAPTPSRRESHQNRGRPMAALFSPKGGKGGG